MKVFIDENSNPKIAQFLSLTYKAHQFRTFHDEGFGGKDDLELFRALSEKRYNAIITADFMQMRNPDERLAVRKAGLCWIGHQRSQVKGPGGLAMTAGIVLVGINLIFTHIAQHEKRLHSYTLKTVGGTLSDRLIIDEL